MKRLLAVTAILFISYPVAAQIGAPTQDSMEAVTLYSACTHPKGETPDIHEFAEQTCAAYLRGMTDGLFMMRVFAEKHTEVCVPSDTPIPLPAARNIFAQWLEAHPQAANKSAGLVAAYALTSAYPCRGPN